MGRSGKNLARHLADGRDKAHPDSTRTMPKLPKPKQTVVDTTELKKRMGKTEEEGWKIQGKQQYHETEAMRAKNELEKNENKYVAQLDTLRAARGKPFRDSKLKGKVKGK